MPLKVYLEKFIKITILFGNSMLFAYFLNELRIVRNLHILSTSTFNQK